MALERITDGMSGAEAADTIFNNDATIEQAVEDVLAKVPETIASKNLFNPAAVQQDLYQPNEPAGLRVGAGWQCSEFIPVTAGQYAISSDKERNGVGFFDIAKNPTRYSAVNTGVITVELGEAFVVFNLKSPTSAGWTWAQLERGAAATEYAEYRTAIVKKESVEGYVAALATVDQNTERLTTLDVFKIDAVPTDNLLDPATATVGVLVSGTTGATSASASYSTSDFIPASPSQAYRVIRKDGNTAADRAARTAAFYNADKEFIGGQSAANVNVTTIANTAFIRISVPSAAHPDSTAPIEDYALFQGASVRPFEYFGSVVSVEIDGLSPESKTDKELATMGDIRNQPEPPNPAQYLIDALDVEMEMTANVLNPAAVLNPALLSAANGVATPSVDGQYFTSDYIPVIGGMSYAVVRKDGSTSTVARISAYYDENKVFLSGSSVNTSTLTAPAAAKFVRFSAPNMNHGSNPATPADYAVFAGAPQTWVAYGSEIIVTLKGGEPADKPLNALATMADLQKTDDSDGVLQYDAGATNLAITQGTNTMTLAVGNARGFAGNDMTNFVAYTVNGVTNGNSDDAAPMHMLGTTLGGNHGQPLASANINAHGFADTEIGRGWLHSNGTTYYVMRIIDANNVLFMADNTGTFENPQFPSIATGTISRSGTTKTIAAIGSTQLFPSIKNLSIKLYDQGGREIVKPATGRANQIKIVERYDVMYPEDILTNLKARAGQSGPPVYDGRVVASIDNVYTITENLTVVVSQTFRPLMAVSFQDFMVTQAAALGNAATTAQYYVPHSAPIGAIDLRKPVAVPWSASLPNGFFAVASQPDPTNPPNRVIMYLNDAGFMIGHLLDRGAGEDLPAHTANTFEIRRNSGKIYPHPVEGSVVGSAGNAIVGKAFSAVVFRAFTKLSTTRTAQRLSLFSFDYDGALYVFADYSASVFDSIQLDRPELLGKRIEVLDAVNCEVGSTVYTGPVAVSANYVEGETCYAVFKIY